MHHHVCDKQTSLSISINYSAALTFEIFLMLFELLKHYYVAQSQKVFAGMEGTSCPAIV